MPYGAPFESLPSEYLPQVRRGAASLAVEFAGTFGPETVERCVVGSFERLHSGATVTTYLPLLAQRFARQRLRAQAIEAARATRDEIHDHVVQLASSLGAMAQ